METISEKKLEPQFKAKWVAALRSGEYKQGTNSLHKNGAYCCLGVACLLSGISNPSNVSLFGFIEHDLEVRPEVAKVPEILRGSGAIPQQLANMNDGRDASDIPDMNHRKSFSEIADYIEANL